jgi:anti-sigma factor (TIGR02949 family)
MSIIHRIKAWFGGAAGGTAQEMISCGDALRLVQEYLDGELEGVSHERLKAHFDVCGKCYPHLKFESSFLEAVKRAGAGDAAPGELRTRVAELIAEAASEG